MRANDFILFLFFILSRNYLSSQEVLLELNWQKPVEHIFEGKTFFIPSIKDQESSG